MSQFHKHSLTNSHAKPVLTAIIQISICIKKRFSLLWRVQDPFTIKCTQYNHVATELNSEKKIHTIQLPSWPGINSIIHRKLHCSLPCVTIQPLDRENNYFLSHKVLNLIRYYEQWLKYYEIPLHAYHNCKQQPPDSKGWEKVPSVNCPEYHTVLCSFIKSLISYLSIYIWIFFAKLHNILALLNLSVLFIWNWVQ